jgi:hypothetical protein
MERAIEVDTDLYMCFIDYNKAFDKVKHQEIIKMLENIGIDGKDLRIIKNMYWQQKAAIRNEGQIGEYQEIKMGVRQGCVLSPDLFVLYSENIMRIIENMPGVKVGGYNFNNLRYADDTVLVAQSEEDLQRLIDVIVIESNLKGLSLNSRKTEVMVVSKSENPPTCKIKVEGRDLKQVDTFKYLGTIITSDGRCVTEIKSRVGQAKASFLKMKNILCNQSISIKVRKRTLQCYIEPVLLYGCEAWTINKQMQNSLEAAEMWFYRRMLKIPWTAKKSNVMVLNEVGEKRQIMVKIRKRQAKFIGHVMRKKQLEYIVTTGKFNAIRSVGAPRKKISDGISTWLGISSPVKFTRSSFNRELWKEAIANASRHGT